MLIRNELLERARNKQLQLIPLLVSQHAPLPLIANHRGSGNQQAAAFSTTPSCTGTATSSATCPRPRCGRSRPCSRRSTPAKTSPQRERRPSEREAACPAPEPRRRAGGNGGRGDAHLLRLPRGALAADSYQQP